MKIKYDKILGKLREDDSNIDIKTINEATYSLKKSDFMLLIEYTTTGEMTLTLPTSQLKKGRIIIIKDSGGKAGTNNITIKTEGGEKIDNENELIISGDNDSLTLVSDENNWFII